MTPWKPLFLSIILIFCGSIGTASAAIIYDNGVPDLRTASFSDFSPLADDNPQQLADNFLLQPGATTITTVQWFGAYAPGNTPPATDNFTIRIFEDDGGLPMVNHLHQFQVGNTVNREDTFARLFNFFPVFKYESDIAPITLTASTTYWLSVINNTSQDLSDDWGWATAAPFGVNDAFRDFDGDPWVLDQSTPAQFAFRLRDDTLTAVPIPSSMLLFGTALAGWIITSRRKNAS